MVMLGNKNTSIRITSIFIHLSAFLMIAFLAMQCDSGKDSNQTTDQYTCPMHPEFKKNEPGRCPICGMNLVEVLQDHTDTLNIEVSDLVKPTNEKILSSIESVKPQKKEIPITIKANGLITYDTRRFENISSRFAGRIEKLYVKYLYQPVQKGQKLFDVYSPEMLTEQQNLLFLLNHDPDESLLIDASKQKLALLGMTETQINDVITNKKALTVFSVYSNFTGYVISNTMTEQIKTSVESNAMSSGPSNQSTNTDLSLREGTYIEKGQIVFSLVNNDVVWAVMNVYETDIPYVELNQKVDIYTENPSRPAFTGKLNFIEPFRSNNDKSLNVRVYVTNKDKTFKIGQLVNCIVYAGNKTGLWIPKTSVLDLGMKSVVFVKKQNLFEAKEVKLGITTDEFIQVISGIDETTEIAVNAHFLIDSESFVKVNNE
jgi:Cu(I)/Ag(I) efflux system membrane fusion protein